MPGVGSTMSRKATKHLPIELWPDEDKRLWQRAVEPGDRFDPGGPASRWSEGSRRTVCFGYRRWLGFLATDDANALQLKPVDRVTKARVAAYVEGLQASIAPAGTHNYAKHLYDAVRVMAPEQDWRWLERIAWSLGRLVPPRSKRHLVVSAHDLVDLGLQLMDEAQQGSTLKPPQRALQYRDGLIIALLATRPIRRRNLTMIRIDTHLLTDARPYRLVFGADETKTKTQLDILLPDILTPAIDTYLDEWRPHIHDSLSHDGLWASAKGVPMSSEAIYDRVRLHTCKRFGHPINLHLFRDCVATTIALENPEHIGIAADLLGHTDIAMTERYYIQAGTKHAADAHAAGLQKIRDRFREERSSP